MSIVEALSAIQNGLKAPKDQRANRYRYRNIEDINEAVKPLAAAQGCSVTYTDELRIMDGRAVCVSTCTLMGPDGGMGSQGFAIVNEANKNMSIEQCCGAASSYARKYAACGLFAIDDSADDPDRANGGQAPADPLMDAKRRFMAALTAHCRANGIERDAEIELLGGNAFLSKQGVEWFNAKAEYYEAA